nr:uncharacterized protein LOC123771744 [Procambarus clarkii]XP_045620423.1 uncharacterized protein LOC123771744 [Procambarus clarkii]
MKLPRLRLRSVALLMVLLTLAVLLLNSPPPAHHTRLLEKLPRRDNPSLYLVATAGADEERVEPLQQPVTSLRKVDGGKYAAWLEMRTKETYAKEHIEKGPIAERLQKEIIATRDTFPIKSKNDPRPKKSHEEQAFEETAERAVLSDREIEMVQGPYMEEFTPENFVEVKKINPITTRNNLDEHRERQVIISQRQPPSPKYTAQALRERALAFPKTSALRKFLEEQDRRANHVSKSCGNQILTAEGNIGIMHGPPRDFLGARDIIFDSTNHLAFCPVYKAASTSWSITLLEIGGYWKENVKGNSLQLFLKQVYPRISNLAASSITAHATRFMVVRHPFERLLSCYRNKFQGASKSYYYLNYGEKMVRRYRKFPSHLSIKQIALLQEQVRSKVSREVPVILPYNPFAAPLGPTFSEFVQFILDAKYDDEHWRTYEAHCSPCLIPFDFILRFESLPEEGKLFIEYLNRTAQVRPRWDNPTQGTTTGEVACSYYSQLSLPHMRKLYAKYKKDFDLYEYSPDKYFSCTELANTTATPSVKT